MSDAATRKFGDTTYSQFRTCIHERLSRAIGFFQRPCMPSWLSALYRKGIASTIIAGRTAEREVPGSATQGEMITKPLVQPLRMVFIHKFDVTFIHSEWRCLSSLTSLMLSTRSPDYCCMIHEIMMLSSATDNRVNTVHRLDTCLPIALIIRHSTY